MAGERAFSSAACILKLEGVEIGWATGFRANENFNLFPIDVMGKLKTVRYEPVAIKYAGSFEYVHMLLHPISTMVSGGNQQLWMTGTDIQIINFQPLTLTVEDQYGVGVGELGGGARVLTVEGWMPESRAWTISYGNVMTSNCSFVCTGVTEHASYRSVP